MECDVDADAWMSPRADYDAFDRRVEEAVASRRALVLRCPARDAARLACEVLTRAQRRIARRNAASDDPIFDRALELRSDGDAREAGRAIDRWQWVLRLEPRAGEAVQLAALLDTPLAGASPGAEAGSRDGDAARRVAARVRAAGADESLAREVAARVVACRAPNGLRTPDHDPIAREAMLLIDADALAFFSLASAALVDALGPGQARASIASAIARMSARSLVELPRLRLRPDVARLVADALDAPFRAVEATG